MTDISPYELVRRDLLERDQAHCEQVGSSLEFWDGPELLQDAYTSAIQTTLMLRQLMTSLKVDPSVRDADDPPGYAR